MTEPKTLAEQVVMRNVKREIGSTAKMLLEQTALAAIEARDKEWRELIEKHIEGWKDNRLADYRSGAIAALNTIQNINLNAWKKDHR